MNRSIIGYWFCLVLGMALMSFQAYKYFTSQLDFTVSEVIVTGISLCLIFAPKVLSEAAGKIINNYFNSKKS